MYVYSEKVQRLTPTCSCVLRDLETFFIPSSICWTCVFSVNLLLSFYGNNKVNHQSHLISLQYTQPKTWLSVVFHLLSFLLSAGSTILSNYLRLPTDPSCYESSEYFFIVFSAFGVAVLFNLISYILVVNKYWFALKNSPALQKLESLKSTRVPLKLSLYLLVFLISWSTGN